MSKVIFDTNVYIYASQGYKPANDFIQSNIEKGNSIIMPIAIKGELLSIPRIHRDTDYASVIDNFIKLSDSTVPIDSEIAELSGEIRRRWQVEKKKKLPFPDASIGATAILHSASLYSNNDKDFSYLVEQYGLMYENPFDRHDLDIFLSTLIKRPPDYLPELKNVCQHSNATDFLDMFFNMFADLPKDKQKHYVNLAKNIQQGLHSTNP